MFQKILVPVDGAEPSTAALEQILQMVTDKQTVITALCVIDTRVLNEAHVYLPTEDEVAVSNKTLSPAESTRIYQNWAQQSITNAQGRGRAAGVRIEPKIVSGIPYQEIISHSLEHDLLVMGTRKNASTYPGPFLYGNTLQHVVAHTRLPVLCVPARPQRLQTMLAAYDGSPEARDALQLSTTLSQAWGLKLVILTTQQDGEQAQQLLHQARLRAAPIIPKLVARAGNPAETILTTAGQYKCDLIALGVQTHHSLFKHSLGKVTDALLRSSNLPLLLSH